MPSLPEASGTWTVRWSVGSGSPGSKQVEQDAGDVVCLRTPAPFFAISPHYRSFPQTPDEEVRRLLAEARAEKSPMGDVETG